MLNGSKKIGLFHLSKWGGAILLKNQHSKSFLISKLNLDGGLIAISAKKQHKQRESKEYWEVNFIHSNYNW